MKKFFLGLITMLLFGFNASSQNLANDKEFIEYINNEYNFNSKSVNNQLFNKVYEDKKLTEDELPKFYESVSTTDKQFNDYLFNQDKLRQSLEKKYSFKKYSNEELNKLLSPAITEILNNLIPQINERRNCRGVYLAQLTLNASVAYGAHLACVGADITVIAGIICHGAVTAGQIAANYIALEDYRDCIGK